MLYSSMSPKRLPQCQRKSVPPSKIATRPVRIEATAANPSAGIPLQARLPVREPAARSDLKSVLAQTGNARTAEARSELRDGARNTRRAYHRQFVPSKSNHILVKPDTRESLEILSIEWIVEIPDRADFSG
jgi:hypothetical protein